MVTALIAGNGDLPKFLIESVMEQQRPCVCVTYHGQTDVEFIAFLHARGIPFLQTYLGFVGAQIRFMKHHHVTHIVMGGGIKRPSIKEVKLDAMGAKWLMKLGKDFLAGDDQLLRSLLYLLEKEGFKIVSASDVAPKLVHHAEVLTQVYPTDGELRDVHKGIDILKAIARFDIGQSLIIQDGRILGVEAAEGTQNLIQRCEALKLSPEEGGVLVKMSKLTQTLNVDLPSLGLGTLEQVKKAKLRGIAFEAKRTQLIHKDMMIEIANAYNIFIYSFDV